jgi:hypothetical protein
MIAPLGIMTAICFPSIDSTESVARSNLNLFPANIGFLSFRSKKRRHALTRAGRVGDWV